MRHIRTIVKLLRYNQRTLIWFEILYKLLGVTAFVPLLYGAFGLSLQITGYRYLTIENIRKYLTHPVVYLMLMLGLLLVIFYTLVDMSAVIYILHLSYFRKHAHMSDTVRFALKNTWKVTKKGNRGFVILAALSLLFFCSAYIPELLVSYDIPNVLQLLIQHRRFWIVGLCILLVVLLLPHLRLLFAFHFYTLEGMSCREARRASIALGRKHNNHHLLLLLLVQVTCYVLYMLFLAASIFVIILCGKLFANSYLLSALSVSVVKLAISVLLVIFSMLGVPASTAAVSLLFYRRKGTGGLSVVSVSEMNRKKNCEITDQAKQFRREYRTQILLVELLILLLTVSACSYYVYRLHKGELNVNVEYLRTMEVTAHRGASWFYPENTMSAFQGAVDAGADWIEVDVHESADGQIFVMHDNNFKRTTGKNAKAWELTYDEIQELDAGSKFHADFAGEKIPLLSDVITFARENAIRLNIEIKPSQYEPDLEEKLVELLREMEYIEHCVVTSQNYSSISKVKELEESITTVYVMSIAFGNVSLLTAADAFSIKSSSITDSLVSRIHNQGKQVYAWTVNSGDAIQLMIEKQVDNIITDNVPLAKKCISSRMTSSAVNDYVNFLNRQMRLKSFVFWK